MNILKNAISRVVRSKSLRLAAPVLLSLMPACFAAEPDVYMPPNQYIHPYPGRVVMMSLPHQAGSPLLSLSHHANDTCAVWLPAVGDPGITQALYECLAVVEIANCNGATDVNTPAVRARASFGEQMRYGRPCSQGHWDWAYDAVRTPVTATQTASAGPATSSQF